jgi:hypothetical protein
LTRKRESSKGVGELGEVNVRGKKVKVEALYVWVLEIYSNHITIPYLSLYSLAH